MHLECSGVFSVYIDIAVETVLFISRLNLPGLVPGSIDKMIMTGYQSNGNSLIPFT